MEDEPQEIAVEFVGDQLVFRGGNQEAEDSEAEDDEDEDDDEEEDSEEEESEEDDQFDQAGYRCR